MCSCSWDLVASKHQPKIMLSKAVFFMNGIAPSHLSSKFEVYQHCTLSIIPKLSKVKKQLEL